MPSAAEAAKSMRSLTFAIAVQGAYTGPLRLPDRAARAPFLRALLFCFRRKVPNRNEPR